MTLSGLSTTELIELYRTSSAAVKHLILALLYQRGIPFI